VLKTTRLAGQLDAMSAWRFSNVLPGYISCRGTFSSLPDPDTLPYIVHDAGKNDLISTSTLYLALWVTDYNSKFVFF
jgi:hypothetical protein